MLINSEEKNGYNNFQYANYKSDSIKNPTINKISPEYKPIIDKNDKSSSLLYNEKLEERNIQSKLTREKGNYNLEQKKFLNNQQIELQKELERQKNYILKNKKLLQ